MEIFKKIVKFFNKQYWLFLLIIVAISYGQTLWMNVWRDANAIFFKFTHLNEAAGYLGRGLLGEGTYKFSVTPYWFVYKIVGYKYIFPYYLLNLFFYFLAAYFVYRLFSKLLSKSVGKLAGFLFASGYIATEGFFSLDSSMILNVSIILISLALISYISFSKSKNIKDFLISIFWYWLAVFLTAVRVHYFIGIILIFDIFWVWKFNLRKIHLLVLRILPFLLIFYFFFIKDADKRTFLIIPFIKSVLSGQVYNLYSTFGTLAYLFLPDGQLNIFANFPFAKFLITILLSAIVYLLFRKRKFILPTIVMYFIFSFVWYLFSRNIYLAPQVSQAVTNVFAVFLGGELILFFLTVILLLKREMKFYVVLLFLWLLASLITYTSYEPTNIYTTVERYVAHSFIPLVGLLALSVKDFSKRKFVYLLSILWGLINLFNNFTYQHNVLLTRSFPTTAFYNQLENSLPVINKNDVLYFDVSDNARSYFSAAFSVGQMPDETAIAWRYGIDRYDFVRLTDFDSFTSYINKNNIKENQVHGFFYSASGLVDTSAELRKVFNNKNIYQDLRFSKDMSVINFDDYISSVVPVNLKLKLSAFAPDVSKITFPYVSDKSMVTNKTAVEYRLRNLAFDYENFKNKYLKTVKVTTTSDWHESVSTNIIDGDRDTAWRPDRVLWGNGKENFVLDLGNIQDIDRFVWRNAYSNNTPTKYAVDVSFDNEKWTNVASRESVDKIESDNLQIVDFKSQKARFVRMRLVKSLNDDSPGISDAWVVPSQFHDLDINETEKFLDKPFGYVNDAETFNETLSRLGFVGRTNIYWISDKSDNWMTDFNSYIDVSYKSGVATYTVQIPAGGTHIKAIKFADFEIPTEINLKNIMWN